MCPLPVLAHVTGDGTHSLQGRRGQVGHTHDHACSRAPGPAVVRDPRPRYPFGLTGPGSASAARTEAVRIRAGGLRGGGAPARDVNDGNTSDNAGTSGHTEEIECSLLNPQRLNGPYACLSWRVTADRSIPDLANLLKMKSGVAGSRRRFGQVDKAWRPGAGNCRSTSTRCGSGGRVRRLGPLKAAALHATIIQPERVVLLVENLELVAKGSNANAWLTRSCGGKPDMRTQEAYACKVYAIWAPESATL